jgi:signal transduction histidine kinase/DNA-binding response OmpR family regulator
LLKIALQIAHEVEQSTSFGDAMLAACDVMTDAALAGQVLIWQVDGAHIKEIQLVQLLPPAPDSLSNTLQQGARQTLFVTQAPLGQAFGTQQPQSLENCWAVPVFDATGVCALMELREVPLAVQHNPEFGVLLQWLQQELYKASGKLSRKVSHPSHGPLPSVLPYSALMESFPGSVLVLDAAMLRLVAVNPFAERELMLSRDWVLGATLTEALGSGVGHVFERLMRPFVTQGSNLDFDIPWKSRWGLRTLNFRNAVVRSEQGAALYIVSLVHDATLERSARLGLQELQNRFEQFNALCDNGFFVSNPDFSRFEMMGSGIFDICGITPEQMAKRPQSFFDHVLRGDQAMIESVKNPASRETRQDKSYRIQHPQKGLCWLRLRTHKLVDESGTILIYGWVSDVSGQKTQLNRLQSELAHLQSNLQNKNNFLFNLSHEIRTPMNGILGMTELLVKSLQDEKEKRFAKTIYHCGESLLEVLNDVVDYSQIEAGQIELSRTLFAWRDIIEDVLDMQANTAAQKKLVLSCHETVEFPSMLLGDPYRLKQVLNALVSNALKFTEFGEVVIEVRKPSSVVLQAPISSPTATHAEALEFVVRDTGIGIESKDLGRLFTPFTQLRTVRRSEGSGLGLAITRHLVELMGGKVSVSSQPGIGSEFSIQLPLPIGPAGTDQISRHEVTHNERLLDLQEAQVWVVHPDDATCHVLVNQLQSVQCAVTVMNSMDESLTRATRAATRPDRLILYLQPSQATAASLDDAEKLVKALELTHEAVIFLLPGACPEERCAAQERGFSRFMVAPVRQSELIRALTGVSSRLMAQPALPSLRGSVLVVEDSAPNQEVMVQMLLQLGLKVRAVHSGQQALRALCETSFDVVLMDIMMPGIDGIEALSHLRKGSNSRFQFISSPQTPVIAVTAHVLHGDEERFLRLGFDGYLAKPFRQIRLALLLKKFLRVAHGLPAALNHVFDTHVYESKEVEREVMHVKARALLTESVLNAEALDRLQQLDPHGQAHLMARVTQAFDTSLHRMLPELQEALGSGNLPVIRRVAHTLKSSSSSIGAMRLSRLCGDLEINVSTWTPQNLALRIEGINQEAELVITELRQLLSTTS